MKRALLALAACSGHSTTTDHPIGAQLGPAVAAAIGAAEQVREPWRCAVADPAALADETLPGWQLGGHTLRRTGTATVTTIAVIADAGGASPATLAGLAKLRGKLAAADLVVALGGMGSTPAELAAVFGVLADGKTPIVVLAGDLEPAEAIAGLPRPMLDARSVRRIELPGATIVTLPGAATRARLVAGDDGCMYRAADLRAALADLAPRPGLRLLAATEAPRGVRAGEPTGELALGAPADLDLVLYAPGEASPAQTGQRSGTAIGLAPGTSDATARIPASRSSAGLLTVRDGEWTWRPVYSP